MEGTKRFEFSTWDSPPQFAKTGDPNQASGENRKQTLEMASHRAPRLGEGARPIYANFSYKDPRG